MHHQEMEYCWSLVLVGMACRSREGFVREAEAGEAVAEVGLLLMAEASRAFTMFVHMRRVSGESHTIRSGGQDAHPGGHMEAGQGQETAALRQGLTRVTLLISWKHRGAWVLTTWTQEPDCPRSKSQIYPSSEPDGRKVKGEE